MADEGLLRGQAIDAGHSFEEDINTLFVVWAATLVVLMQVRPIQFTVYTELCNAQATLFITRLESVQCYASEYAHCLDAHLTRSFRSIIYRAVGCATVEMWNSFRVAGCKSCASESKDIVR